MKHLRKNNLEEIMKKNVKEVGQRHAEGENKEGEIQTASEYGAASSVMDNFRSVLLCP